MAKVVGRPSLLRAALCTRALLPQVTLLRSFHLSARDRRMPNDLCSGRSNTAFEIGLVAAKPLDFPARHHSMRGLP
jgi:hypothetical protein